MSLNVYDEGRVLLFNKPFRWTSFDVVRKIRYVTRAKKVGHAGTLDPLATGLLIVCTGKFTRQADRYQAMEKEYTGTFFLGATTPSFDLETAVDEQYDCGHLDNDLIQRTAQLFVGETDQSPPLHSAINIGGERAYEKARRGEKLEIPAKKILIREFEIVAIALPLVHFRVVCSKGTYIRSLARDYGKALNCGAHLTALCRTRIGEFRLDQAEEVNSFVEGFKNPA